MKIDPNLVNKYLQHPVVQHRLRAHVIINRRYDVPGLAACSKNGRVVYIDRDVVCPNKPLVDFALITKTMRDVFHLHPSLAKYIAVHSLMDYASELKTQVKRINSSRIRNLPPDLDTNIFLSRHARYLRNKNLAAKRKKALTMEDRKSKMKGIKDVDRDLYQARLPGLL